jgi:superoxide dismutase, Cu-Zn family
MNAIVDWDDKENTMSVHGITGNVKFYQRDKFSPVIVTVVIYGLPDGLHGFHVHEKKIEDFGEDVVQCCDKLGGHFNIGERWSIENQAGTKHGIDGHTGDLCNNIYSQDNFCEHYFEDSKISLFSSEKNCIIDRSIVIHEDKDDLGLPNYIDEKKNIDKFITGNAGKRIACGNIKYI